MAWQTSVVVTFITLSTSGKAPTVNLLSDPVKRVCLLAPLIMILLLSGCSTTAPESSSRYQIHQDRAPDGDFDVGNLVDAVPRYEEPRTAGNMRQYTVWGKRYSVMSSNEGYVERGIASWYGEKFHGHKTSNGETFDMYAMSAAHKSLRIPGYARVTNLDNGRSVIVRVNDRGPFHDDRLIDLSYAAAKKLGYQGKGTAPVEVAAITVRPDGSMTLAGEAFSGTSEGAATAASAGNTEEDRALFVQLGSFGSRSPAEQLSARVRSVSDQPVRIRAVDTGGGRFHRVQVGPFDSEGDAKDAQNALQARGFGQSILLTDNR